MLLDVAGRNATKAFEDVGHSDEARALLKQLRIGVVAVFKYLPKAAPITQQPIRPLQDPKIPIFLSFSKPIFQDQKQFIRKLSDGLMSFGMTPRTLGVTVYDIGVPLVAIKNLMSHSAGLICVASRRTHIKEGEKHDVSNGTDENHEPIRDKWFITPWPHIGVCRIHRYRDVLY